MVGFDSILLIAVAALLLFGPDKLPQYLRELGKLYAEVKKAQREFERELNPAALVSAPAVKSPSPHAIEIARKLGINTDGKTEDELLIEIDAAVSKPVPATDSNPAEKDI
jgi:TatA/E family protein of Tat protein translocase